ncbi:12967_t:CDS:2 [Entrophospora sp. SA101]|nr:12967_t:CDS:2 [Entrophospora sp. SA101]
MSATLTTIAFVKSVSGTNTLSKVSTTRLDDREHVESQYKAFQSMENDEFLEYLASQIWEEGILQRKLKNDDSNDSTAIDNNELFELSEQEIIDKIFEIINQDFINFEICNNENEILEISKSILQNYKSTISPLICAAFISSLDTKDGS